VENPEDFMKANLYDIMGMKDSRCKKDGLMQLSVI